MKLDRRNFLRAALAGVGLFGIGGLSPRVARATASDQLVLVCYLSGGWDQLLAFDPRPANAAQYSGNAPYEAGGSGIHPAYDLVNTAWMNEVLAATNGSGIRKRNNVSFGPAVPAELLDHANDLCVLRGLNMSTLTHEVGRRFFTTGQFPRGLQPVGSSLSTIVANAVGPSATLPNLSLLTESYNVGMPPGVSPIQVRDAQDVRDMLRRLGPELSYGAGAINDLELGDPSCFGEELDTEGTASFYRESRVKAKSMVTSGDDAHFDFDVDNPGSNAALFEALGITKATDFATAKGRAAVAAQALTKGVARAVSLRIAEGLDTHNDWATDHPDGVRDGLMTLAGMIAYLKSAPSPFDGGGSAWDHTTLLVFSEFSRTPLLNNREGRDHHLSSSCVVAGPGIKGGQAIGATTDQGMATRPIDLVTGAPKTGGITVGPADVIFTLLHSMGITDVSLGNQPKNLIEAMLKPA
ncbi:MAG: DUF1501 domain-containing protein [Polyangiaceae bacterium]|nr:DUF1501 domain-containing protein [Polyangiaceae bacterium]